MPLTRPNLDDRTFQDIVDEAKRLIPQFTARSGPTTTCPTPASRSSSCSPG